MGDGSAASILAMNHTGLALGFQNTMGTNSYPSMTPFQVNGIGIAGPTSGSAASGAIGAKFPAEANETGYQYVTIDDVNIGVSRINSAKGANINYGLSLANVWKSRISNTRMFSLTSAGAFVNLSGTKNVDIWFDSCVSDGPYYGYLISCYCEGIRINNHLVIAQVGFINGGEFNTFVVAANLYQINQGYILDTHFACAGTSTPAIVTMVVCVALRMQGLLVTGSYPGGNSASIYGIAVGGALNQISNVLFENLANGVQSRLEHQEIWQPAYSWLVKPTTRRFPLLLPLLT